MRKFMRNFMGKFTRKFTRAYTRRRVDVKAFADLHRMARACRAYIALELEDVGTGGDRR